MKRISWIALAWLSSMSLQSAAVVPGVAVAEIKGRILVNNNFIVSLNAEPIECASFETTRYSACLAGTPDKSQVGSHPSLATMLWISRKLEPVPCVIKNMNVMCRREQIVDVISIGAFKIQDLNIIWPRDFPCSWRGNSVLTLLNKSIGSTPQSVFAAWQFDLAHERIVTASTSEVTCQDYYDEEARWERGKHFWHGWDFDTESGIEGMRRLGKVLKEEDRTIENAYDQPVANVRDIQYDGLLISVAILPGGSPSKKLMQVVDVVITSPAWPVRYGLAVGSTRAKVENALGHHSPGGDYVSYGDADKAITFRLDKDDKVTEINWHMDDTDGRD